MNGILMHHLLRYYDFYILPSQYWFTS